MMTLQRFPTARTPLQEARAAAGLSLLELAARAKLSIATVHIAERAPQLATSRTIERVAKVLGVDPSSLKP